MGRLESAPYDVEDGREYVEYLTRVQRDFARLVDSGRLPATDDLAAFMDTAEQVIDQVRRDVAHASATGRTEVVSVIEMSPAEHTRMVSMNDSLRTLLEILEIRQALELNRTPAVGRVSDAIQTGRFTG